MSCAYLIIPVVMAAGRNNNKNHLPNRAIPTMSSRMPPILTSLLLLPVLTVSGAPAPHKKARGELKALEPYERDSNAVASAEAPPQAGAEKKDLERIKYTVLAANRCFTRVDDCSDVDQAGLMNSGASAKYAIVFRTGSSTNQRCLKSVLNEPRFSMWPTSAVRVPSASPNAVRHCIAASALGARSRKVRCGVTSRSSRDAGDPSILAVFRSIVLMGANSGNALK